MREKIYILLFFAKFIDKQVFFIVLIFMRMNKTYEILIVHLNLLYFKNYTELLTLKIGKKKKMCLCFQIKSGNHFEKVISDFLEVNLKKSDSQNTLKNFSFQINNLYPFACKIITMKWGELKQTKKVLYFNIFQHCMECLP